MTRYLIFTISLIMFLSCTAFAADVIIVNRNNPINDISSAQLKKIYNGRIKFWDNGTKVIPVDMVDDHPCASRFANIILEVDLETKRRYWIQKLYSGLGSPPQQEKNFANVISVVASEPGAIGYVKKESVTSAVKLITVDGKQDF